MDKSDLWMLVMMLDVIAAYVSTGWHHTAWSIAAVLAAFLMLFYTWQEFRDKREEAENT